VTANGVRLRQAVLAAAELEPVAQRLRDGLGLGEPYSDPGVGAFGLRNAVFAVGDRFLEVVSPVEADTAAGRWLDRRGGDAGYMVMFQVEDLDGARARARSVGVREVFAVDLDDIAEVHLHPADMRGAIVAVSQPAPPASWRWGGPGWEDRSVPGGIDSVEVGVADAAATGARWAEVLGVDVEAAGAALVHDPDERGLRRVVVRGRGRRDAVEIGGVVFEFQDDEEESDDRT
jgi:Glyoxalase-like domain